MPLRGPRLATALRSIYDQTLAIRAVLHRRPQRLFAEFRNVPIAERGVSAEAMRASADEFEVPDPPVLFFHFVLEVRNPLLQVIRGGPGCGAGEKRCKEGKQSEQRVGFHQ